MPLFMKLELRVDDNDASGEDSLDDPDVSLSLKEASDESRSFEGILDCELVVGSRDAYMNQ